jgi:hypothetical protein
VYCGLSASIANAARRNGESLKTHELPFVCGLRTDAITTDRYTFGMNIVSLVAGVVMTVMSFFGGLLHLGLPPMPNGQGQNGAPLQAAIAACQYQALGSRCRFTDGARTIPGTCLNVPNESQLVCIPTN